MGYGKTIELFFVDGTADGIVTAELSNWNAKAIKIPRTDIKDCKRDDIKGVGVYFLFCVDEEDNRSVYIGEAEDVLKRLKQHITDYNNDKEKYYWTSAVAFVGSGLDKALIRYIENGLVERSRIAGKADVLTRATFTNAVLKESQIATCEEFMDNVRVLISALGYNVLTPAPTKAEHTKDYLYLNVGEVSAKGFVSSSGFTVLKGSKTSQNVAPQFEDKLKRYGDIRKKLEEKGIVENHLFVNDYEFTSPTQAASVILGYCVSGNAAWKNKKGINLKEMIL